MRKILIATHSKLAEGFAHAISFFAGNTDNVTCINAYVNDLPLETEIDNYFKKVEDDIEVLVFTDLFGGSVNRAFLPYIARRHTHLVTGINISIILELMFLPDGYITREGIEFAIEKAKNNLVYMNTYSIKADDDDE